MAAEPVSPKILFQASGTNTGEWYFYNASLKSKGYNDFRSKWGKRANSDNWRRLTAAETKIGANVGTNPDLDATVPQDGKGLPISQPDKPQEFSYESLMSNLPLTKELVDTSNFLT